MKTFFNILGKVKVWLIIALSWAALNAVGDLMLPYMMKILVDNGILTHEVAFIYRMIVLMLVVAVGNVVVRYMKNYFTVKTAQAYAINMRSVLFEKVLSLLPQDVDRLGASSLITRTTNDIVQVQTTLDMALRVMIKFPVNCIGGIVIAFLLDIRTACILLAVTPVLIVFSVAVVKGTMPLFAKVQKCFDAFNKVMRERLSGIRVIHAFNRIADEEGRSGAVNDELTGTAARAERKMAVLNPTSSLVMNLTVLGIVLYGIFRIEAHTLEIGALMALITYSSQTLIYAVQTTVFLSRIPRAIVSAKRVEDVMRTEPIVRDSATARESGETLREIAFTHVSFRYAGAEKPVLDNVSFSMARGEVTAIIGSTGSGKTTILNLMERFAEADSGQITFDGDDIRDLKQSYIRRKLSLSPQQTYIFGGPVRSVLLDGKKDATEEEIRGALEAAQAEEFVSQLEKGLDTEIAQGGASLSGGQRQRLSIARALIRKPDFYLFDDSFSALDFKTELKLRQALKAYTQGAGVVIVAQRVGTIMDADKIIVMDEGTVAGIGRHEELLESCAVYREIVSSQLSLEVSA